MPLGDAHARPRGLAARLRGLRARLQPASPRRRREVLQLRGGPTIVDHRRRPGRRARSTPANPVWSNLLAALKASGDPHVAVRCCRYQAQHVPARAARSSATRPTRATTVLAAVEAALRARFSFDARALGAAGAAVRRDRRRAGGAGRRRRRPRPASTAARRRSRRPQPSLQARLLASRMRVRGGVALPAELLTLDSGAARSRWRRCHEHASTAERALRAAARRSTASATPSRASRCARWSSLLAAASSTRSRRTSSSSTTTSSSRPAPTGSRPTSAT